MICKAATSGRAGAPRRMIADLPGIIVAVERVSSHNASRASRRRDHGSRLYNADLRIHFIPAVALAIFSSIILIRRKETSLEGAVRGQAIAVG